MTLDEAIIHAEEVAERLENSHKRDWMCEDDERCAKEHRQLASWLKDLKRLKEQGSVLDKIRAKVESINPWSLRYVPTYDANIRPQIVSNVKEHVLQIIEKYRAESEE